MMVLSNTGFETVLDRLPKTLPVFPLPGVLLLPRCKLPLNVFEPRYIAMFDDALASDRLIGMIQPEDPLDSSLSPELYRIGCVGRISAFAEAGNRYSLTLTGVCRFTIASEVPTMRGYRRVVPDWTAWQSDFHADAAVLSDRDRLIAGLRTFFATHGLSADWSTIDQAPDEILINSLAMSCPFPSAEKQGLLEAPDLSERMKLLVALVEMAILTQNDDDSRSLH